MNYIRVIKIINRLSIVFVIMNLIASLSLKQGINSLIFLWTCGCSFLIYIIGKKKSWAAALIVLLSLFPIVLANSSELLAMEAAVILCGAYISYKEIANIDYESEIDSFKRGLFVCIGLLIFSLITVSIELFSSNSAPYILIYFVSSVIILRTLRFVKYNKNNKDAEKINKRYSAAMISLSAVLSIKVIRDGILKAINFILNIVMDVVFKILAYLLTGVGYAISFIIDELQKILPRPRLQNLPDLGNISGKTPEKYVSHGKSIIETIEESRVLSTALKTAVVILILYLIIKLLKTFAASRKGNDGYIEESEFVKKEKDKSEGYLKKLKNFLKPKSCVEYIRHYYKKFMKLSTNKGIIINGSDTTRNINQKASRMYNTLSLEGLRDIYIRARYGYNECSKEDTKKVKEHYQSIVKQK